MLFEKQTQILKRIATQEDCVVVGWAGVFILPRHRGMFSVFCQAPKSFRVKRVMNIYHDLTEEKVFLLCAGGDFRNERNHFHISASVGVIAQALSQPSSKGRGLHFA